MALGKSRAGKEVGKQIPRRGKRHEMVLFWEVLHLKKKKKPKNLLSSIKCELEFTSENSPWSPAKWHLCSFHHHFYFSFPTFFALTRSLLPFFLFFTCIFRGLVLPRCLSAGAGAVGSAGCQLRSPALSHLSSPVTPRCFVLPSCRLPLPFAFCFPLLAVPPAPLR